MRRLLLGAIAACWLTSCSTPPPVAVPPQCADAPPPRGLAPVAFLVGTWADRGGGTETEEHWIAPRGDTMLGVNRTVKGGRTVHREFLMIERTAEGVFYRAWPVGQAPASFRLVASTEGHVTFEDPQHDFPQRITYELASADSVRATVEGTQDGKPRRESWIWRRESACQLTSAPPSSTRTATSPTDGADAR